MLSLLNNPISLIIYLISLFVAISIHEFAHAWTAEHLGDPTPRLQGRVTLDPRAHIDLYGLVFLFLFGFGWGKPVQFDPYNLKNPRRDAALIGIAGPLSNILLALLLAILLRLFIFFHIGVLSAIGYFLFLPMIALNVSLAVFNLIPISPLDGFKIVGGLLDDEKAREWYGLERYGYIFLLFLILPLVGQRSMIDVIIRPISNFLLNLLIPGGSV